MSGDNEARAKLYHARYCGVARKVYELGGDHDDLASALGVPPSELQAWQKAHPEFSCACAQGKSAADDRVEESLHKLAAGYEVRAEKVKAYKGRIIRQEYKKVVLPNAAAAQFCLTAMDRRIWKPAKDVPGHAPKDVFAEWFNNTKFETVLDIVKRNEAKMMSGSKEGVIS